MLVRQILSSKPDMPVLTISPDASISDAAAILAEKRIGALIVSSDGNSVDGILSERDIVREIGERGSGCLVEKVSELMTSSVVGCAPGDTVPSVLEKMTDGRFRHMPVIEDGRMIGVVSIGDAVKARIDEVENENSALTEMIAGHG